MLPGSSTEEQRDRKYEGEIKKQKKELEIVCGFGDSLTVCKGDTFRYLLLPDLSV